MTEEKYSIKIIPNENSRIGEADFNNLAFGKVMSDHMLVADYDDGEWKEVSIMPFTNFNLSPALSALHYGQSIFEGIKAYKFGDGRVSIFRPDKNFERFNKSAARLEMPQVPEDIFIDGMKKLVDMDRDWVPEKDGCSLYIRPYMFATEAALGVHASKSYKFVIITCPVGSYYNKPLRVKVETEYTRAAKGGVGFSKNAGNYALSLYPTRLAQEQGFDQLIWTDASTHKYIEEAGTANLVFMLNGTLVTPGSDTVLQGITRYSIMSIAEHWGIPTETRDVTVKELIDGIENGSVTEAFAAGTAATLTPISEIGFEGKLYTLSDPDSREFSKKVLKYLNDLRYGNIEDSFGWNFIVGK